MKYKLLAINKSGAATEFEGHTIKEALHKFDFMYCRGGFKIKVYSEGILVKTIKSTFR